METASIILTAIASVALSSLFVAKVARTWSSRTLTLAWWTVIGVAALLTLASLYTVGFHTELPFVQKLVAALMLGPIAIPGAMFEMRRNRG